MAQVLAVQDLSESHITKVPKNYIAPVDKTPLVSGLSIPLIDLRNCELSLKERQKVVRDISQASSEWGFFQVVNHGIDVSLLEQAQKVSRGFFHLPREEKQKWAVKKFGFMDDGYGSRISPNENAVQLWRDFLLLCTFPLAKRNVNKWPAHPPEYRETMSRLSFEFIALVKLLLGYLSEGLGLPTNYFEKMFGEPTQSILTNYYPACPEPGKVLGIEPHSDFGGLTLLLQDGIPGLDVLKDENKWVAVEPIAGALTVNISDLLELMSNGRYKSAIHRVRVNRDCPRMSIASNFSCAFDARISPAPELIDVEHPQLYKSVVFGEYVKNITEKGPAGKSYMLLKEKAPEYVILRK